MDKESFLFLSLKEKKSKKIAQAMSNDSCRRLLDYVSKNKSVTETKAAKDLKIPLSTVHYNFKLLVSSGLVISEEFHYSEKGKEVSHYRLANKLIIIGAEENSMYNKLKEAIPASFVLVTTAAAMWIFQKTSKVSEIVQTQSADEALFKANAAQVVGESTTQTIAVSSEPTLATWFLAGGLLTLIVLLITYYLRNKN